MALALKPALSTGLSAASNRKSVIVSLPSEELRVVTASIDHETTVGARPRLVGKGGGGQQDGKGERGYQGLHINLRFQKDSMAFGDAFGDTA